MPVTEAAPSILDLELDPFAAGSDMKTLEQETIALEEAANNEGVSKEKPQGSATVPDPDEAETEKPEAGTESPAESETETVEGEGAKEGEVDGEADGKTDDDELKSDDDAEKLLEAARLKISKVASAAGKQATRADIAEREVESRRAIEETVQAMLEKNPEAKKIADQFIAVMRGEKLPKEEGTAETVADMSKDELEALADIEEMAPVVKAVRGLMKKLELTENRLIDTENKLKKHESSISERNVESLEQECVENKFDAVNELHRTYPELDLGKNYTAETLESAYTSGSLDVNSGLGKKLVQRAKNAMLIYTFFCKGPRKNLNEPLTLEEQKNPYYVSVHTARRELLSMNGKLNEDEARGRVKAKRDALRQINEIQSKSPGVNDIPSSKGESAHSAHREPKSAEEAQREIDRIDEIVDRDGRELTLEESKRRLELIEKWEL